MEKINRIVHISDIHLRNFKRHEEYRRVFHKLYKYIGDTHTHDTLILLTGDIVHSKTDVTPELYEEVQLFLKTLCQFGPTLMIPGNHDANLNNSDRLDALTPVVNAINEKNLIYLKETEIRTIGGVDFYHWSVFDNVINYPKPKDTNRKKICLYHGLVNNSVNDFGYVMKSETIKTSMFDGFDMVMLGDIHTHQSLNPSGTIKYPGSLIQQNHGEGLVHGILVWDVKTNSSEFVEIDNDTAFYTVDIENGVYSVDYTQLPQNIYLRVRHKTTSQEDLKKCIREIKSNRNVVETTVAKISDFDAKSKQQLHGKGIDFRNPNSQNEYIRLYLKTVHRATEEDILAVCELNNAINSKLSNTETPRNTIWSPKRFEFENMFGYKKNNYIDFSNMEGTYGIFAPNASGKSTLLDAVTYCLFDKCSKTSRAQEVMNNQSESFKCKFSFELNDRIYFIERSARKLKQGNVRVDVNFYYLDDLGNDISLNGKDRSDTNSNIRKILGSYEDFILTSFSTQSGNASFIDIGQRERKDLLCQFMDLNVFEELYLFANEESKEVGYVLKDLGKNDWELLKTSKQTQLSEVEADIKKNRSIKEMSEEKLEDIQSKLTKLVSLLKPVDNSLEDFDEYSNEEDEKRYRLELTKNNFNIVTKEGIKSDIQDKLNKLTSDLSKIDKENIDNGLSTHQRLIKLLGEEKIKLKQLETEYKGKLQKMEKLKDLKYDENCKFCMDNVFVKDAIETKSSIKEDENKLEEKKTYIKEIEEDITTYSTYEKENKSYNDLQSLINETNIKVLKVDNEIKDLENTTQQIQKSIDDTVEKAKRYLEQKKIISENKSIEYSINTVKGDLQDAKEEDKKIESEFTKLQVNKNVLENDITSIEDLWKKHTEYSRLSKIYKYYLESIHRDGIPHNLISKTLPQIEEEVNGILSQLVDFKVLLTADTKNINGYIAYSPERYWGIELVSGMEKFITSLAIRCALINVSSLPRPNFLWIDEGFGALDKQNMSAIVSLFEYLKSQFQFTTTITHIESMRDMVDSIIEITKSNGISKIQHQ